VWSPREVEVVGEIGRKAVAVGQLPESRVVLDEPEDARELADLMVDAVLRVLRDDEQRHTDPQSKAVVIVFNGAVVLRSGSRWEETSSETDDGTIIGIDGLTTRHTRHRLILGGVELWTWCAYDIVGIAAALKTDAIGDTQCGLCGRRIEVVILEGEPQTNTVVGWLPDESCTKRDGGVLSERTPLLLAGASQ